MPQACSEAGTKHTNSLPIFILVIIVCPGVTASIPPANFKRGKWEGAPSGEGSYLSTYLLFLSDVHINRVR